jgi:hypothetical protein
MACSCNTISLINMLDRALASAHFSCAPRICARRRSGIDFALRSCINRTRKHDPVVKVGGVPRARGAVLASTLTAALKSTEARIRTVPPGSARPSTLPGRGRIPRHGPGSATVQGNHATHARKPRRERGGVSKRHNQSRARSSRCAKDLAVALPGMPARYRGKPPPSALDDSVLSGAAAARRCRPTVSSVRNSKPQRSDYGWRADIRSPSIGRPRCAASGHSANSRRSVGFGTPKLSLRTA